MMLAGHPLRMLYVKHPDIFINAALSNIVAMFRGARVVQINIIFLAFARLFLSQAGFEDFMLKSIPSIF